jgi:hypothetical protein
VKLRIILISDILLMKISSLLSFTPWKIALRHSADRILFWVFNKEKAWPAILRKVVYDCLLASPSPLREGDFEDEVNNMRGERVSS